MVADGVDVFKLCFNEESVDWRTFCGSLWPRLLLLLLSEGGFDFSVDINFTASSPACNTFSVCSSPFSFFKCRLHDFGLTKLQVCLCECLSGNWRESVSIFLSRVSTKVLLLVSRFFFADLAPRNILADLLCLVYLVRISSSSISLLKDRRKFRLLPYKICPRYSHVTYVLFISKRLWH